MKWLSVKKHKIPLLQTIFVRDKENQFWIGEFDLLANNLEFYARTDESHFIHKVKDVTHFCLPDPVEIEDE